MRRRQIGIIVGASVVLTALPFTVRIATRDKGGADNAATWIPISVESRDTMAGCRWNHPGCCVRRAARAVSRAASTAGRAVGRAASDTGRAVARAGAAVVRAGDDAIRRAARAVQDGLAKAKKLVEDGLKKVGHAIAEIGKKIGSQIAAAAKFVKEGLEYLVKLVAEFWEMIVDWVVAKAKEYAKKAVDKAKEGVQKIFAGIKEKARQASEKLLRPVLKELAEHGIKLPFPQIERLAKLQRGGKIDENAVRAEVRKYVLAHLDPHIVPHVKWAVTEGLKTLKTGIDTLVRGVAAGLGSIPIVGGPVFAAVIFTYNFAFEQVTTAISQVISNLVKNTMLGGIIDELLKPIIKRLVAQVQKLIDATGIPALAAKITAEVKRNVELGKKLVDAMRAIESRVEHLDTELKAKVEAVVARKIAAAKKFDDIVAQAIAEGQKAAGSVPSGGAAPSQGGRR